MANIYWRAPTADELAGTSYTVKDFIDNEPHVEVWDENWEAINLYRRFSTQWRMGANGPIALDLTVFFHELDRKQLPEVLYDRLVHQLGIIEPVALKHIHNS